MSEIRKSMGVDELNLKPEISGSVRLSEDMQQTLALLTALGVTGRKVLKASESGILYTESPRIKDIEHFAGTGANDEIVGTDIVCSDCLVMGHPDNTGLVWVRPYKVASASNAWPLTANDVVSFTLNNLKQLNALIVVDGEKIIVAYTI